MSYARRGLAVRLTYLAIAICAWIWRGILGRSSGVVVLCYHAVTAPQQGAFTRQMRHIARRAVPLAQVCDASTGGANVAVTFDDAYKCLLDHAVPVTRNLGIPITVYAVSGNLGRLPAWNMPAHHPDATLQTMTAEELQALAREPGCSVGSHTVTHRPLGDLEGRDLDEELVASRRALEAILARPVDSLALPHGSYRPDVIERAARHGYRSVLTLDEISSPEQWFPGTIGRFSVSPDMWMIEFALTVRGAYSWLYGWRRGLRRLRQRAVHVA